jgi:hypothetical protein
VLVEFVVASGRTEQGRAWTRLDAAGAVEDRGDGAAPGPADVVFTAVPGDAAAIAAGELDLSVGFMRGQVKVAGDPGALLRVLPMVSGRAPVLPVGALLPR